MAPGHPGRPGRRVRPHAAHRLVSVNAPAPVHRQLTAAALAWAMRTRLKLAFRRRVHCWSSHLSMVSVCPFLRQLAFLQEPGVTGRRGRSVRPNVTPAFANDNVDATVLRRRMVATNVPVVM